MSLYAEPRPAVKAVRGFNYPHFRPGSSTGRGAHCRALFVAAGLLVSAGLLSGCQTLKSLGLPWPTMDEPPAAAQPPGALEGGPATRDEALPATRDEALLATRNKTVVAWVQRGLTKLGYAPGRADGIPGRKTRRAISAYQSKAGLVPNGQVSIALADQIEKAVRKRQRRAERARKRRQTAKKAGGHKAAPPVYEVGTTFVYSNGRVETVAGLKGDMVRWVRGDGTKFTAHRNFLLPWFYWQTKTETGALKLNRGPKALWPKTAGRELSFAAEATIQDNVGSGIADRTEAWHCRFDGTERLTVTAGRFKTLKMTCVRDESDMLPALERTWYYAPAIGHYVRVVDASPEDGLAAQETDLVAIRPSGEAWPPIARAALSRAVKQALDSGKSGEETPWTSSGVTTRVTIKPTSGFRAVDGKRCRTFLQTWAGSAGKRRYPSAACQDSSGRWRIPGLEESTNETLAISGGTS